MLKKFLVSASVAGLIAGAASALEVENVSVGADAVDEATVLAEELDFAGGAVVSVQGAAAAIGDGETEVTFYPTAGLFPTGNVLIYVDVTGGEFANILDGSEVDGTGTSVISSGGGAGTSSVVFLVSGADACNAVSVCSIDLPLELTGGDVSFSVGLQTDAGAPVDNSSATDRVSETVVTLAPAFDIEITPDTTANVATLASLFTAMTTTDLGDIATTVNTVTLGAARTVNKDLDGTNVLGTDAMDVDITISGEMDAFAGTGPNAGMSGVLFNAIESDDIDDAADEATLNQTGLPPTLAVTVVPDGTTSIARSSYSANVVITPTVASGLTGTTSASGDLESITRDGTSIIFPWTQTSTQGAASGTVSVYRIGNLDTVDAGAVFVEVQNSSEAGFMNPGIVEVGTSIDAGGELVTDSTAIETAVGNYGRGDLEFTIEADPDTLTARQFVVRNGVIQQVSGGTIQQDLN